jgi:hypothetical protein
LKEQQICPWQAHAGSRLDRIDHLIHRTGQVRLHVGFGVVSVYRDCLAVIDKFDIGITAGAPDTQLVGPAQFHLAGACELDFLQFGGNDLDIAVERGGQRFLAAQIVRHRFENVGGIIRPGCRGRCKQRENCCCSAHRRAEFWKERLSFHIKPPRMRIPVKDYSKLPCLI